LQNLALGWPTNKSITTSFDSSGKSESGIQYMTKRLAGSLLNLRFAIIQRLNLLALLAAAFAAFIPQPGSAQQAVYYDFNGPAASSSSQTSAACLPNSATTGVLFCFNFASGSAGLSFIQDSYPPSIDPNAAGDGDSGSTNYALQLNENAGGQDSSVWYSTPVDVANGFNLWYAVKLDYQYAPPNYFTGDGLAFVIQNAAGSANMDPITNCSETGSGLTVLGTGGGGIGYCGIDNSLALEMDTFWDSPYDPSDGVTYFPDNLYDDNHMALQSCGPGKQNSYSHETSPNCLVSLGGTSTLAQNPHTSAAPPATASAVILADSNPHQVVMVYNGPNDSPANYLYVYLDAALNPGTHTPVAGSVPLFSGPFDITNYINLNNGAAYIGFTAATGGDFEQHELMGFSFTPHGFGSVNVCPPSLPSLASPCSATLPVNFNFSSSTTVSSIKVVTQGATGLDFQPASGSTCVNTFSAGGSCSVDVTFAPIAPGLRMGAVELLDGSGNVLAAQTIYGTGLAPLIAFSPLAVTSSSLGTDFIGPTGMTVDASGNVYIADTGNSRILKSGSLGNASIGVGLVAPRAVAIDGAGDLYVADTGLNSPFGEVLEIPAGCASSGCQVPIYAPTVHPKPLGVAVDGPGDLYIADNLEGILEYPANGSGQTTVYNPTGSSPSGVAVDAAGDLFIADTGLEKVVEIPVGCTTSVCQVAVGTGWLQPDSVAVDAAGDVYVADSNSNEVVEVPPGCMSLTCEILLGTGVESFGVAVDGSGNVYFPDYNNNVLDTVVQAAPSLSFASTLVHTPSAPQSVTIQNIGNQPLVDFELNIGPGFLQAEPVASIPNCASSGFTFQPGQDCNLGIEFEPGIGGPYTSTANLQDNSLNGDFSIQNIGLTGTGLAIADYTLTVSDIGSGSGSVTDNLSKIACTESNGSVSGSCSGSYASGTSVTLTAASSGTSKFQGWGGACASSGTSPTCSVSISAASSVTASFDQESFGSVSVCAGGLPSAQCTGSSLAITFNLSASTTIGSVQVVTEGITGLDFTLASSGTCNGPIAAGSACTANINFAPLAPGLRQGAVELLDNGGNLVASEPVYGVGQGAEAVFGPGTQVTLPASGIGGPAGAAVDVSGDIFFADSEHNRVVKITPAGVQTTVPFSGLNNPFDVALDGAGDVFVADSGNDRVVEVTPGGVQTTVPATGLKGPNGVAVNGAGDVFITDLNNNRVIEVTPSGVQTTVPTTGLVGPYWPAVDAAGDVFFLDDPGNGSQQVWKVTPAGVQSTVLAEPANGLYAINGIAVDAAGDVYLADQVDNDVVEISPSGVETTLPISGLNVPAGLAVDGSGNVYIPDSGNNRVVELQVSQPPSFNFALTNQGSTSSDSPHPVSIQNVGNQTLAGTLTPVSTTNFTEASGCASFTLVPGGICSTSFSFNPTTTGYLTDQAFFSDNNLNLAASVVAQNVNLTGVGDLPGQTATTIVPNVVGMTQSGGTSALNGAGLSLGAVTSAYSAGEPAGSVIGENPAPGSQVNPGSPVALLISIGEAPPPAPNPLTFENNYFVTGDYASAGTTLRGAPVVNGMATGTISIPSTGSNSVPTGADIIDAFLYWETLEYTATPSGGSGTFLGYPITGQQIGSDQAGYVDGAFSGTLRAYRADVNEYLPVGANGVRSGSGSFSVALPSGGANLPLTEGASLVIIYRVLVAPGSTSPAPMPLKSVVIYDGLTIPSASGMQNMQGFYDAVGGASGTGESTALYYAPSNWNNNLSTPTLGYSNQYNAPLAPGNAYAAEILSTPVNNSDNDGILDSWKAGPGAGNFFAGQPGYYDVKTQSWVPLPGAKHGQQDLFVQLDWMCGGVNYTASGPVCTGEDLYPSPDSNGNDPLAIVTQAFLNTGNGIHLHLQIGNMVPESTCTDSPGDLCQFPSQPGVIGWKNSLEFSKIWPRNFNTCAAGGDCTARFPYGQKDSYHYVLFGHSLTIPAWSTRYGSVTGIMAVAGGSTTITTTGVPSCPSRITISGVLGDPGLNGVYNTTGCTANTMTVATPSGVPTWTFPNTLPEPVIGITSGTVTSISGYSDLGGADSAVTLALWETSPTQNMSTRANVIAGTLFHEIGHTIGLSHGGLYYQTPGSYIPTFDVNCKPNYQSVMNYLFQIDGLGPNSAIAYSNQTLATLNDSSLSSAPFTATDGVTPPTFSTSAWYAPYSAGATTASPATMFCDGGAYVSGDPQYYRVDGSVTPSINPPWASGWNITYDSVPYTTMLGYNDVSNIDLRQIGATGGEFASLSSLLSFGSLATPLTVQPGGNANLGNGGTVSLGNNGTVSVGNNSNVTVSSNASISPSGSIAINNGGQVGLPANATVSYANGGTITVPAGAGLVTLGSGGLVTLGSGGLVTLGSGGLVTLGSGGVITSTNGTVTIPSDGGAYTLPAGGGTITLAAGGTVSVGSGGLVTLGSGGLVTLGSGGLVTLGSGGLVTLGSGGLVTLGSGGLVTLGSGGNVTLSSGGLVTLGSGGLVTLGSGGLVTLGSGGLVTLGSGGISIGAGGSASLASGGSVLLGAGGSLTVASGGLVTLGSGGTITSGGTTTSVGPGTYSVASGGLVTLGSGGLVTLGSGGLVTLGSGGLVTLGSGGLVTLGSGGVSLGSGGLVTLGSGGVTGTEMDYDTANSVVRPPPAATYTPTTGSGVRVDWTPPVFGVVNTYTVSRSVNGGPAEVIGSVSGGGASGFAPATTFTDTNPPTGATTLTYTITTSLVPDSSGSTTQRQSLPSPPAVLTLDQSIVLGSIPSSANLPGPLPVNATAETNGVANNLQVSFSASGACSVDPASQSISGGVSSANVDFSSTGTCTVTASQSGTSGYNAATSVSGTFTILPQNSTTQSQTINFPALANIQYGGSFSLAATSTSGQPVTFSTSGPCSISGKTTGVGLCTITASATANSTYSAASVSQSFTITPAVITVTANSFTIPYGQSIPTLTYTLSPTVNSDPASVVSGTPALSTTATATSNAGTYTISVATGSLAAQNYSFLFMPGTLTIQTASQTISFTSAAPSTAAYKSTFPVAASATSGLTVMLAVDPASTSVCSLLAGVVTMNSGTGTCTIDATQAGNANYNAATKVTTSAVATKATPAVSWSTAPPASAAYNTKFTVVATTNSTGAITYSATGGCSNVAGLVTMTSGTTACQVSASAASDANYVSGTVGPTTVNATEVNQTITFTAAAPSTAAYKSTFPVAASSTSGLTVSLAVDSSSTSVCSLLAGVVTMNSGTGTCTIDATQTGNANYNAATEVKSSAAASKISPTITWSSAPPASAAYNSKFTVAATTNSTGTITYSATGGCSNVAGLVTMTSGTTACQVSASAASDPNYTSGTLSATVAATPLPQAITFTINPPATAAYNTSFTVAAGGGASLNPVTFSSSGSCSNTNGTYIMTNSTGTCSVIANQLGNANYSAAPTLTKSVTASGPVIAVSPSSVNFGTVYLNGIAIQTITVSNTGNAAATISTPLVSLLQAGNSDEYVAVNLCPSSLAAGKSCTVTIGFYAGAYYSTPQTATLKIMDSAPGSPQPVSLTATVINPQASFSPTSLSFGTIKHATSSSLSVTLSNPGATPLNFSGAGISITGTNASSFTQTNTCGSSLAAGAKCTITVKFTPATTGSFSANLTVVDNAQSGGGTQTVPLSGKGD
jgi:sugar lactone lactonase YvrE